VGQGNRELSTEHAALKATASMLLEDSGVIPLSDRIDSRQQRYF